MIQKFGQAPQTTPMTPADWDRQNTAIQGFVGPSVKANADALKVTVTEDSLGGVPVLRITPPDRTHGRRILVYLHGGAYTLFSAKTSLTVPALMAVASGTEVISIDYTLAPQAKWQTVTDQVVSVYRAILASHDAQAVGLFGDSAGGGLAAGAVLKLRDLGLRLPGALYLLSPWSDITETGDSYTTLADADPTLDSRTLNQAALAYADPQDQKNPYVSPIYGNYSKAFPPTLIQGGTREIFLSNFVREYQAIRGGGHEAILDLYEGMPHVFQAIAPFVPETQTAMRRAASFFDSHLGNR